MKRTLLFPSLLCVAALAAACAQSPHAGHDHGHGGYAGLQQRSIKALSDTQVADLRAGRGMGLALPAELNGYPGPMHVLELAGPLALSDAQRSRTQALFERMRGEAQAAGQDVIAAETALDALFKERRVTPAALAEATSRAAAAQGRLRETHLRYHLAMMEVLTPDQVGTYNRLRGY